MEKANEGKGRKTRYCEPANVRSNHFFFPLSSLGYSHACPTVGSCRSLHEPKYRGCLSKSREVCVIATRWLLLLRALPRVVVVTSIESSTSTFRLGLCLEILEPLFEFLTTCGARSWPNESLHWNLRNRRSPQVLFCYSRLWLHLSRRVAC